MHNKLRLISMANFFPTAWVNLFTYTHTHIAEAQCNKHKFGTFGEEIYFKNIISTGEQLTIAKFMPAFQHQTRIMVLAVLSAYTHTHVVHLLAKRAYSCTFTHGTLWIDANGIILRRNRRVSSLNCITAKTNDGFTRFAQVMHKHTLTHRAWKTSKLCCTMWLLWNRQNAHHQHINLHLTMPTGEFYVYLIVLS